MKTEMHGLFSSGILGKASDSLSRAGRLFSFLILLVVAPFNLDAREKITLQLKWKHAFQFAGYYAAIEKGYYREADLDVQLVEGGAETHFAEELTSGRADYAVALSSMLIHRNEGKPVVALAAILQHSPEVLLVTEASGINTPHQMAGRTVAASPEDTPALLAMFKNEGLRDRAVNLVPYEFSIPKMTLGKLDGMGAYTTNEPFVFARAGVPVRKIQPRDYGVDFYGDCLFTTENEIRKNPKRTKQFLEASLRGWHYAMRNPEEMIQLILRNYTQQHTPDALRYEAAEMEKLMFSDLIEIGHMNEGRWRHIGNTYVKLGMLPSDYSLDGFLYDRNPEKNLTWLWWSTGLSVTATLLLAGIVIALIRINRRVKTAERQAQEAKSLLQTVLDTIPVGVFWKDREYRYIGANRVFAEQAGLPSALLAKGLTDKDLPWVSSQVPQMNKLDEQVMETGIPTSFYEDKVLTRDGKTTYYQKSKVPLRDRDGRIIGVIGVSQDISALKESEKKREILNERIQHVQKYESLYRLAGGISHHFNNMFQIILGHAELAEAMLPKHHEVRTNLEKILHEIRRASRLGHLLLASVGQGAYRYIHFSVDDFIRENLSAFKCCVPERHEILFDAGNSGALINADPENIKQLLLNLLTNASEALGDTKGTILIRTGQIPCTRSYLDETYNDPDLAEGTYFYLDVIDQGEGIEDPVMKKIFDPFFSTRQHGRGLGLAAVLGIVRSHKGAIKINSLPGQGTTVRILFPSVNGKAALIPDTSKEA